MTETTIDEPTDVTTPEPSPIDRPLVPTSPRELLLSTYHANTVETAERILGDFDRYGFELARKAPLDAEQRARAEALRTARGLVEGRTPISTAALTPIQTSELIPLARFILTGSEFIPGYERPQVPDPGPLGEPLEVHDQGDVGDVLRTPDVLRKAMQTAAAARP